jgi:hypothetical protein
MIQMTTAATPLSSRRSVQGAYTTGRDDGAPGLHPGHTPYMNLDDWSCSMTMGCPSRLYTNCYPANFRSTWPVAEGYFNTRYVWAHNEFTPQQTMRGKMALYGYLYGIGKAGPSAVQRDKRQAFSRGTETVALIIGKNTVLLPDAGTYTVRVFDLAGRTLRSVTRRIESKAVLRGFLPDAVGLYFLEVSVRSRTVAVKRLRPW